jgi:hypothetical protein
MGKKITRSRPWTKEDVRTLKVFDDIGGHVSV